MAHGGGNRRDTTIDIGKTTKFNGGLEFFDLTYTVLKDKEYEGKMVKQEVDLLHRISGYSPKGSITAVLGPSGAGKSTFLDGLAGRIASGSLKGRVSLDGMDMSPGLIKRTSAYIMQDDRLFPKLTVYETLMFAADFRLGPIPTYEKKQRVENMIEQLGLSSARNTYIGDEGTRGVSGGERRRVSIGVDIIHGPSLLFLDEPTSGLDSTSAYSVIEKVHNIARTGSTVVLTIHQPSSRILSFLDHLIILARGQLMFQGSPKDVNHHLSAMGRKVPQGESPIEYLMDVIRAYDQSEFGVEVLAEFARTGMKPPHLTDEEISLSTIQASPVSSFHSSVQKTGNIATGKRLHLQTNSHALNDYNHSLRSPYNTSRSWSASNSVVMQALRLPQRQQEGEKNRNQMSNSSASYAYSFDVLHGTPTPHSSDYTVNENDYLTSNIGSKSVTIHNNLGKKISNSFFSETWILMRRNFKNISRTPELFLSRLMVLTVMGFMMATMFMKPKENTQGITDRLSFFIFTVCLFFFSSNDAVPAFIQERFIFIRETSHNAYRASSYTIAGLITHLPFLGLQALVYAGIVWFALKLRGSFIYFLIVLYMSLLSTNSFVVFISSVVPNYILGYAAVIAFTALFFLFCGYFLNSHDIPPYWKWMNKISTMTYPYEGLLMNEYQTPISFGKQSNGTDISGINILESLHISTDSDKKWENVAVMFAWAVLYRILFYLILRFASKNQRK
ncbi:ABC transporter G family member STR2-like [Benincasa hispida]|uniref:ABC transporter G family member STR2-like n=1 Tax=Benincasa hispida TaxID=102211 RepID=UPI00190058E9|nr:ABC transporter G family member STR2-like [Benincasa hispida]